MDAMKVIIESFKQRVKGTGDSECQLHQGYAKKSLLHRFQPLKVNLPQRDMARRSARDFHPFDSWSMDN